MQKSLQQQEETVSQALTKHEQRINNIRVDLNLLEEQLTQRMAQVSFKNRFSTIMKIDFRVNNNYQIKYVINKRIKICGEEKLIKRWLDL